MRWLIWTLAGVVMVSCVDEQVAPVPIPTPAFRHDAFYETLLADADRFGIRDGDWLEDYGDAPFYGLAFYAHAAPEHERTAAARARALALIADVDFSTADLQEVTMSALGLMEYADATDDHGDVAVLDAFVDEMDGLARAIGYYVPTEGVDSWALRTYGPTAISALIGLVNAEHAVRIGSRRDERVAFAREMATHIAEIAYDGKRFAFAPDEPMLCLYPNVAMILLDGRLFQLTGDVAYRNRALKTYEAIQELRLSDSPTRYYSPYSAEYMGATTTDYSTLSSHNYLMLSLAVLYEISGERRFVDELDSVLDALEQQLYGSWCLSHVHEEVCEPACSDTDVCVIDACSADSCGGGILHHWMDGRPALPTDPEYFCSGCNLQTLYVMWYRRVRLME